MADIWPTLSFLFPSFVLSDATRWRFVFSSLPIYHYHELNVPATSEFAFLLLTVSLALAGLCYAMSSPPESPRTVNSSSTIGPDTINQEKRHAAVKWDRRKPALTKRKRYLLIILFGAIIIVALALGLALGLRIHHATQSTPVLPIVDLGYARYQGSSSNGVDQWLGIRYAAAPTGELRFAAPAPPPRLNGIQSATQVGESWKPRGIGLTDVAQ